MKQTFNLCLLLICVSSMMELALISCTVLIYNRTSEEDTVDTCDSCHDSSDYQLSKRSDHGVQ